MFSAFDILKKLPDGGIVWVESVRDLEAAQERIKTFASYKPGEYVVFSQETQSVVTVPWVSFSREEVQTISRKTKRQKSRKKARGALHKS